MVKLTFNAYLILIFYKNLQYIFIYFILKYEILKQCILRCTDIKKEGVPFTRKASLFLYWFYPAVIPSPSSICL